eukprot:TRINITY_DN188_c0_g2_i1.p1 TRINITY_DN188_c0_g2~~TRINITY_DN188_c0_g2_i1.p1  ORF type:complete len:482 (+),score=148.55 TRINITY_DN188_c0_g2_i1:56-1447(+)
MDVDSNSQALQEHFEETLAQRDQSSASEAKKPEDLSGDGGVLKEIIKEGDGWEKPAKGSDVSVHYTGTLLDGSKFDSSRDRNSPFKFQIDAGSVIKGWDVAVKSMKKGEVAKFTLKPEYAYGASGSPPKIPANATLVFEIELLSFTNEKDLTSDGGVLKKVLQEAKEKYGPSPSFEAKVKVHIVGRLAAGGAPFIDETRSLTIGDEEMPSGVEKAIESLKVEEKGLFTIRSDYAYGAEGNAQLNIPANANLQYEIQLLEMTKEKDYWQYDSFDEKFEQATLRKNQGNTLYTQGKYARAIAKYKRGADFVDYLHKATDEEKAKANTLKVTLFLNTAQCHLKTRNWNTAIEQCNKALEIDKKNPKGIFRRAQAHSALDNWDAARADFEQALVLLPGDADVIREYNKLKAKIKAQDERDRKVYSSMFKSMFASEPKQTGSASEDKMDVDTPAATAADAAATPVAAN